MSSAQTQETRRAAQILEHQRSLFAHMDEGFAYCNVIYGDDGAPLDYRFIEVNQVFERQTGLHAAEILGKTVLELFPDVEHTWIERFGKITVTGWSERFEEFNHNTGRYYETFAYSPEPPAFFLLIRDITARKRAEQDLMKRENGLRLALQAGKLATWNSDRETGEYLWDEAATRLLGYPPETDASYQGWARRVHPEDLPRVEASMRACARLDGQFCVEYRIFSQNDELRWVEARGHIESDEYGNIVGSYGVMVDITDRKRAEEELRLTSQRFELALRNSPVVMFNQDLDLRYTWIYNPALGYDPSQVLGKRDYDLFEHGQDAAVTEAIKRSVIQTGISHRQDVTIHSDGIERCYDLLVDPLRNPAGDIIGVVCAAIDRTERRRNETALAAERMLTETVIEKAPCCLALIRGHDLVFQLVNARYQNIAPGREIVGRSVSEVWPELAGYEDSCRRVLKSGEPFKIEDEPFVLHRGPGGALETAHFTWSMHRIELPEDGGWGLLIKGWETTARKQAEQALRLSQARLAAIIGSASDAIITIDSHQRIVMFNTAAESIFGYASADMVDQPLDRLIPAALRDAHRGHVQGFGASGTTVRPMYSPGDLHGLRASGETFPIEATISQANVDGENLCTVILRDVTERKQMEAALLRNEKLASVGRMATSIAHEINNPLAAVSNLLYLAKDCDGLPPDCRRYIQLADAELSRIAHITRQSLGFYRESNNPVPTRITSVLDAILDLLKARIESKRAAISVLIDSNSDAEITAVPGELRQVFSNLLANSLDAIDTGGTIRIKVSECRHPRTSEPCLRITLADTGHGIPVSARRQLFEPFFTTKQSIATGLGLWISKQLVDKHHGTIQMRSSTTPPRTGTAFSVRLPLHPPRPPAV